MANRIVGYFENWAQYRQSGGKFMPSQINPSLFTHVNFAFGLFGFVTWSVDPTETRAGPQRYTGDYTIQPVEWNDQTVLYPALQALKQQNGALKTLLSIGGWSMNSGDDMPNSGNPHPYGPYTYQLFSKMAADAPGRTQFIGSAIAYAQKYGFDGIDIDWEYPGYLSRGGDPNDLANFLALVQEFRATAGPGFLLTMAAPAIVPTGVPQTYHDNPSSFFQWLQQCSQSLDWLNIMSYDYHGAFDDPVKIGTGVNSPLVQDSTPNGPFSIKQTVDAYRAAGIAADKMVLGMPTYGRSYTVANPSQLASNSGHGQQFNGAGPAGLATQVPGVLAYYEISQKINSGELVEQWDDATLTPYAYSVTTGEWVSYDNPRSLGYKTAYVNARGLGGAMVWSVDDDDFANASPLLTQVKTIVDNPQQGPELPGSLQGASADRRFNKYCSLCTHNAYKNYEDFWTGPNQSFNLYHQLDKGVRSLMLDIYYEVRGPLDIAMVISDPGVYVLGEVNQVGWIDGITYSTKQPAMRLHESLNQVGSWLDGNPNEVVTIFLEDYTTPDQLETEIGLVNQSYQDMMYHPGTDSHWQVPDKKDWPLLSDLIAWKKRLILFSDHHDTAHVAYDRDFTKQNYWSLGSSGTNWDCPSRWNGGQYQDAPYPKLFLFNHYRDVPTVITAALDNTYEKIMDRIENRCQKLTNQLPNFVGVDFFELPVNYNKAGDVVAEINRRFANG